MNKEVNCKHFQREGIKCNSPKMIKNWGIYKPSCILYYGKECPHVEEYNVVLSDSSGGLNMDSLEKNDNEKAYVNWENDMTNDEISQSTKIGLGN